MISLRHRVRHFRGLFRPSTSVKIHPGCDLSVEPLVLKMMGPRPSLAGIKYFTIERDCDQRWHPHLRESAKLATEPHAVLISIKEDLFNITYHSSERHPTTDDLSSLET